MTNTRVTVAHVISREFCSVSLTACETPTLKLDFKIIGPVQLAFAPGTAYEHDAVGILCGSGLAFARSKLNLDAGISVCVLELSGLISTRNEVGVCIAVAVAIAINLGRNHQLILDSDCPWELVDLVR